MSRVRTRPARSYTQRLSGYALSFNQAGILGAGLGSINLAPTVHPQARGPRRAAS